MSVKPVPRKRRREKEIRQAKAIAFVTGALLLLAKMFLAYLAVLVLIIIVHWIEGDFSQLGRTAGSIALFLACQWALLCMTWLIITAIKEKASNKLRSGKNHPDDTAERIDKPNRNTSRKRIAKKKTLAKKSAKKKRAK